MNTSPSVPQHTTAADDLLRPLGRTPRTSLRDRVAMHLALRVLLRTTLPVDPPAAPATEPTPAATPHTRADLHARHARWLLLAHLTTRR